MKSKVSQIKKLDESLSSRRDQIDDRWSRSEDKVDVLDNEDGTCKTSGVTLKN
jgi:hypothetical protein